VSGASTLRAAIGVVLLAAAVAPAEAQFVRRDTPRRGSTELSVGGIWTAGNDEGDQRATLTRNPTTGAGTFDLFTADTTLGSAIGVQARIGFYLSPKLAVEGGADISRPELRVHLTADTEGAPDTTATEKITSFIFTGSLVYQFSKRGRSMTPFILGGAGHVRDLHQGSDLVETGLEYHGGAGIKWWSGKGRRKTGLRVDGGVSVRDGGNGTADGRRIVPTAAASLAYLF